MCTEPTLSECGCHGTCGCDVSRIERIKRLEMTRYLLQARVRCTERAIAELKESGHSAKDE